MHGGLKPGRRVQKTGAGTEAGPAWPPPHPAWCTSPKGPTLPRVPRPCLCLWLHTPGPYLPRLSPASFPSAGRSPSATSLSHTLTLSRFCSVPVRSVGTPHGCSRAEMPPQVSQTPQAMQLPATSTPQCLSWELAQTRRCLSVG